MAQVAAIASEILGKQVRSVQTSLEEMDSQFAQMGVNVQVRAEMRDLLKALGDPDGVYAAPRTPDAVTPTSVRAFMTEKLG